MSKREGYDQQIPRLLKLAFDAAKVGDTTQARRLWQAALKRGYDANEKTERSLFRIIEIWEKESR